MTIVSYYLGYILSKMHCKIKSSSGLVQMWHSLRKQPWTFRDTTTAWFPCEMTPKKQAQKCHTDNPSLPRSRQYFWLVAQSKKFASTNQMHQQIWAVIRHLYGISKLVSQTSFRGETSGGVKKCRLFSQDRYGSTTAYFCFLLIGVLSSFLSVVFFQPQIPITVDSR